MNTLEKYERRARGRKEQGGVRPPILIATAVAVIVVVGAIALMRGSKEEKKNAAPPAEPTPQVAGSGTSTAAELLRQRQEEGRVPPPPTVKPTPEPTAPPREEPAAASVTEPAPTVPATPQRPEPSGYGVQLVQNLTQMLNGPVTEQQAATWNGELKKLVAEGANGAYAIRNFLEQNQDIRFDGVEGADLLGYPSLRMAMLDALQQIGGPEATGVAASTLQSTSDPREIGMLANYLVGQDPDAYRGLALNAARETIAMASSGQLPDADVGPLFNVLKDHGDASVINELQQSAGRWKYYSAIALAGLPDDAGVPALVQMAQDVNGSSLSSRLVALEMVAQLSTQSDEARTTLLNQARQGAIPDATWLTVASVLEGHQFEIGDRPPAAGALDNRNVKTFHLAYGNQNYFSTINTEGWTPQDIQSRIGLIDELMTGNNSALATEALQRAKSSLSARLAASP